MVYSVIGSATFTFLGELGLFFSPFVIDLEIDLQRIAERGPFIVRAASAVIVSEEIAGTIFVRFVFGTSWLIAGIVALSFATVGEAIALPVLEEPCSY